MSVRKDRRHVTQGHARDMRGRIGSQGASVGNGSPTLAHLLPGRREALAKRMRQPQAELFLTFNDLTKRGHRRH